MGTDKTGEGEFDFEGKSSDLHQDQSARVFQRRGKAAREVEEAQQQGC